ncbi:dipeptidase [Carboxylicivirga marina]|uniref:Dipeptidase n=1 Tax=Carboxylicivirga marina TaxID=2800988 RepID=A0ABS1HKD7_9BACT|nr:C69 family dipeptidase [Carboxylicivirga marina]MBK3518111.1 C69 family dipeptidase [Carboxylicivirga marina]
MKLNIALALMLMGTTQWLNSQIRADWEGGVPEGCTTITVGKDASFDGSVMTSHTDDSHRTRSWMNITPPQKHGRRDKATMYSREKDDSRKMPAYKHTPVGEIPQVRHTYGFINSAYPCMNTKQLAIGESTFGGRESLVSEEGLIDCQRLIQLMLERCTTARQAIKMADELTKEYGYRDWGECLTIADKNEVWHLEMVGPGKGKVGAIWVAQRVPDKHVSVNANAARILEVDTTDTKNFMYSDNLFELAKDSAWWNPEEDKFRFAYAYAPEGRESMAARRREWRTLSMMAPSLDLDPEATDYPFSVKPDEKVTLHKMIEVFKDYYEHTPYDMVGHLKKVTEEGDTIPHPYANPFMPYDKYDLHNIEGGWGKLGERTIARWYTMYGTITQSRDWLPDEIGGLVWMAQDNIATSVYIPIYCSVSDLPASYKAPGRNGFNRNSAWWAFNRMSTLASLRWNDARHDVDKVFLPLQEEIFDQQRDIELAAMSMGRKQTIAHLTRYTIKWGNRVVNEAWKLGDDLWTKYDEKF